MAADENTVETYSRDSELQKPLPSLGVDPLPSLGVEA
jgi:hypothetical protein